MSKWLGEGEKLVLFSIVYLSCCFILNMFLPFPYCSNPITFCFLISSLFITSLHHYTIPFFFHKTHFNMTTIKSQIRKNNITRQVSTTFWNRLMMPHTSNSFLLLTGVSLALIFSFFYTPSPSLLCLSLSLSSLFLTCSLIPQRQPVTTEAISYPLLARRS